VSDAQDQILNQIHDLNRRQFLGSLSLGIGAAALSQWWPSGQVGASELFPASSSIPRAKRVIFLCMAGGPSHLETFDEKPKLALLDGQPMPESFTRGMPIAQLQGKELRCLGPRATFGRYGESGQLISDYLPHISTVADDIAIVKSMVTEQINHDPAISLLLTGFQLAGRPTLGAWLNYALGSENENLPGFISFFSRGTAPSLVAHDRMWGSGFLTRNSGARAATSWSGYCLE